MNESDVYIKYLCCIEENGIYTVVSCNTYIDGNRYIYPDIGRTLNHDVLGNKHIFYEYKKMRDGRRYLDEFFSEEQNSKATFQTLIFPMMYMIKGDKFKIENDNVKFIEYANHNTMRTVPHTNYQNSVKVYKYVYLDNYGSNSAYIYHDNFNYSGYEPLQLRKEVLPYYSKSFYEYNKYLGVNTCIGNIKDRYQIKRDILSPLYTRIICQNRGKGRYGNNTPLTYQDACQIYKLNKTHEGRELNIYVNRALFDFIAYPYYGYGFSKLDIKTLLHWYKYYDDDIQLDNIIDLCKRDPTYLFPIVTYTSKSNIKQKYTRIIDNLINRDMTEKEKDTLLQLCNLYKHMYNTGSTYVCKDMSNQFLDVDALCTHLTLSNDSYYFKSIYKMEEYVSEQLRSLIDSHKLSIIYGAAGTGKTTKLIDNLVEYPLEYTYVLSPTGKASNVIRNKIVKQPNNKLSINSDFINDHIRTIHSFIGKVHNLDNVNTKDGILMSRTRKYKIIIDEFSMVSMELLLMLFNCLVGLDVSYLFIGDYNQLQPIGIGHVLLSMKEEGLLNNTYICKKLDVNHRTKERSNIHGYVSTLLGNNNISVDSRHVRQIEKLELKQLEDPNGIVVNDLYLAHTKKRCSEISSMLRPKELISCSYISIDRDSDNGTKKYSMDQIYDGDESRTFYKGDLIMLKKNVEVTYDKDNTIKLYNGMYGIINNIREKNKIYTVDICMFDALWINDGDISLYNIWVEQNRGINKIIRSNENAKIYNKITNLQFNSRQDNYITECEDSETRSKDVLLIDDIILGYCITVHSSQGSESKNVYLDVGNNINKNWLYTGITRARENIYFTRGGEVKDTGFHCTDSRIYQGACYNKYFIRKSLMRILTDILDLGIDEYYTSLIVIMSEFSCYIPNILMSIDEDIKSSNLEQDSSYYLENIIRDILMEIEHTLSEDDINNIVDIIFNWNDIWSEVSTLSL